MKIKILVIFGTRPEAIKMAPLIIALKNVPQLNVKVCVTAQHRQMLDQVLSLFEIKPDYDLDIMTHQQSLPELTSKIVNSVSSILENNFKPDIILVHGDTTTSFAASLAAYYKKIKIGHVEAGLRSGNLYSPWPEEANRSLISVLSDLNFCPTLLNEANLIAEGVTNDKIYITGNTVIDALRIVSHRIDNDSSISSKLEKQFRFLDESKKTILVTCHRRENFGDGMKDICSALRDIVGGRSDLQIVFPVHMNPNIKNIVHNFLADIENIYLVEPLDYLPFVYLMKISYIILTDSGGIQEEAPAIGKPVLVMRDLTERQEALDAGTIKIIGNSSQGIVESVNQLMNDSVLYSKMANSKNPYGDGSASKKIINILIRYFKINEH